MRIGSHNGYDIFVSWHMSNERVMYYLRLENSTPKFETVEQIHKYIEMLEYNKKVNNWLNEDNKRAID